MSHLERAFERSLSYSAGVGRVLCQGVDASFNPASVAGNVKLSVFVCEERRVRSQNSVLNRKLNQIVHEFSVFAVQVEVVENGADSTHRPQLFRKRIAGVGRLFGQFNRIRKFQRFVSVDLAGNLERSLAGESVSTGNDKLFAGKDVEAAVWIQTVNQRDALLFRLDRKSVV